MRHRTVIVAPAASDDIVGIVDRSWTDFGMEAALALDERIDAAIRSLDRMSERGRIVAELRGAGITTYRELVVQPYRVTYRVEDREVWVVAVFDRRRNLEELLFERVRR